MRGIEYGRHALTAFEPEATGRARHVGRVGALAVALGIGSAAGAMPLSGEGGASPGPERGLVWSSSWRLTASDFLQFLQDAFLKEVGC